ncbi:hypothetical protein SAMN05421593_2972 [Chryseobacterium culicis]|uniref:Uncharacterized protein n=1 Tax=Chryseobacterium culicis TaxID=680127 RepID=A0A1H6HJN5_CHRCI|nr:hypothetical protein SAMN05421593_2972 [Chryseobacterium culicis]
MCYIIPIIYRNKELIFWNKILNYNRLQNKQISVFIYCGAGILFTFVYYKNLSFLNGP